MDPYIAIAFFLVLLGLELIYFKIALRYNIVDNPNHRSSHNNVTIRGGGIIFIIAFLTGSLYFIDKVNVYFLAGLFIISLISFIDDIKPVSNTVRIVFHLVAVGLLFKQLGLYIFPGYLVFIALIFVIGTINAVNFMDGINGITGAFGLLSLITLYYLNEKVAFTDGRPLFITVLAVFVFLIFNFRKVATCFAGDVGSVSLAFIILFFLLQLVIKTGNLNYLLILLAYGLDTCTTIFFRLLRKENIFKAHRSHFYQYLANECKMNHLAVATLYFTFQLIANIFLILFLPQSNGVLFIISICSLVLFAFLRLMIEGPKRLTTQWHNYPTN